jgi:Ser/Thr protein kinase RdoA (MazF antagonist)
VVPLAGGRVTPGVVRVGDTVRRPQGPHSPFVHDLLLLLEAAGFDAVPRFLGVDDLGREVLSFVEGEVPDDLVAGHSDEVLVAAARLIRGYHDAVAGCALAGGEEIVCHDDLSPCNAVFRDGLPRAWIDFDDARPGSRVRDLAYALFSWLNLGTDGPPVAEQGRRARLMLREYGSAPPPEELQAELIRMTAARRDWHERRALHAAVPWWQAQHEWLRLHARELAAATTAGGHAVRRP